MNTDLHNEVGNEEEKQLVKEGNAIAPVMKKSPSLDFPSRCCADFWQEQIPNKQKSLSSDIILYLYFV